MPSAIYATRPRPPAPSAVGSFCTFACGGRGECATPSPRLTLASFRAGVCKMWRIAAPCCAAQRSVSLPLVHAARLRLPWRDSSYRSPPTPTVVSVWRNAADNREVAKTRRSSAKKEDHEAPAGFFAASLRAIAPSRLIPRSAGVASGAPASWPGTGRSDCGLSKLAIRFKLPGGTTGDLPRAGGTRCDASRHHTASPFYHGRYGVNYKTRACPWWGSLTPSGCEGDVARACAAATSSAPWAGSGSTPRASASPAPWCRCGRRGRPT